jgi:hypothetical protein
MKEVAKFIPMLASILIAQQYYYSLNQPLTINHYFLGYVVVSPSQYLSLLTLLFPDLYIFLYSQFQFALCLSYNVSPKVSSYTCTLPKQ